MILNLLKTTVKWSLATAVSFYLGYLYSPNIQSALNNANYAFTQEESGFVKKEQALNMKIVYEKNISGNLETFLKIYDRKIPFHQEDKGITLGDTDYLASNLPQKTLTDLCQNTPQLQQPQQPQKSQPTTAYFKKFLFELYQSLEGEK